MSKVLVIDSLARSGTTLLTALINSQARSAAVRGMFHEGLACGLGSWPYGMAGLPLMAPAQKVRVEDRDGGYRESDEVPARPQASSLMSKLRLTLRLPLRLDAAYLRAGTLQRVRARQQIALFDEQTWQALLDRPLHSLDDLDAIYQHICRENGLAVLGLRWNQGSFYAPKWLSRPEHYWCTIVRHPLDRAASAKLTHNWPFEQSLAASLAYAKKITALQKYKTFRCVYYEDLVENPAAVIGALYDWLGCPLERVELEKVYGQHGKPYRSETAELVREGTDHRTGKTFGGIYTSAIGRQNDVVPPEVAAAFASELSTCPVYSRYWASES